MAKKSDVTFQTHKTTLSDGSTAFDVYVIDEEGDANHVSLCFPCITEADAISLRDGMIDLIRKHTNMAAEHIDSWR